MFRVKRSAVYRPPHAAAPGEYDARRGSAAARGYGWRWQKARDAWLREHPLCVMCERDGAVTAAVVVDHIIAHKGDVALFWDRGNWQSLCKRHHDREKHSVERGRGGGKSL